MATATWVKDLLDENHVAYEELHHPEAYTAQTVAQREHMTGHRVAKVVVAFANGRPVELVLPASRRVNLQRLRELLGDHDARLATEDELERYFADCEVGAIPPLRHWQDVEVIMDAYMQVSGHILFQAGTHCDAVRVRFDDWFRMVQPRVEWFSAPNDGTTYFTEEDEE